MKKLPVRRTTTKSKDQYALRVSSGFNQGALITLSRKKSILGRSFKAAIPLEDEKASREHTSIIKEKDRFFLQDMGSTNGTYLNDELVHSKRELSHGDLIRIGSSVFRFEVLRAKGVELGERWKNATCVIPRAHFSFEELSKIQPDKYRMFKKGMKKLKRVTAYFQSITLREVELFFTKLELHATKIFFRFHKAIERTRFIK
ncbi:MAG: FHA domain-containing protein [Bdellovibrionota bacterium]